MNQSPKPNTNNRRKIQAERTVAAKERKGKKRDPYIEHEWNKPAQGAPNRVVTARRPRGSSRRAARKIDRSGARAHAPADGVLDGGERRPEVRVEGLPRVLERHLLRGARPRRRLRLGLRRRGETPDSLRRRRQHSGANESLRRRERPPLLLLRRLLVLHGGSVARRLRLSRAAAVVVVVGLCFVWSPKDDSVTLVSGVKGSSLRLLFLFSGV